MSTRDLDQIIQRILTAGVLLGNTPAGNEAAGVVGEAIGELDNAVHLLRSLADRVREPGASLGVLAARLAAAAADVAQLVGTPGHHIGVPLRDAAYSLHRAQVAISEARAAWQAPAP